MSSARFNILLGLVAALLLLPIAGCGDSDATGETQPLEGFASLDLTLDGVPDPETVGVLTANDLGHFREAGIGLTVATPLAPERPIPYVVEGLADIVVSYQPQVVLAREEGLPVVAFGSLVSGTTMAMIWLEGSGIDEIADLKGKTIAIPGVAFQRDFLEAILRGSGLSLDDVKVMVGGYGLAPLLAEGKADAIFGGSGNVEGAMLEAQGLDPVVTPATELGVPEYDELVFVTRRDRLARHPNLYRHFVEVATAGAHTAQEDPAAGGKAIVGQYTSEALPQGIRAGVDPTLPLLSEDGEIDQEHTAELIAWMHEQGMIENEPPVSALLFEE
jgi:putative hydroxymethylpyrimidine transport system substrate-binding protein